MNVLYYSAQIKEQLQGSIDYIKKAIACKADHPTWATTYAKMSEAELGHAKNLLDIYEDELSEDSQAVESGDMQLCNKIINDMYVEYATKAKCMHEIFNNK